MKLLICYAFEDLKSVRVLETLFKNRGHQVFGTHKFNHIDQNILKAIDSKISEVDVTIFIVTEYYLLYPSLIATLNATLLGLDSNKIITLVVGDCFYPTYLLKYNTYRLKSLDQSELRKVVEYVSLDFQKSESDETLLIEHIIEKNQNYLIELKKSYRKRKLTLICGSGVSVDVGFPSWNELLSKLLYKGLSRKYKIESSPMLFTNDISPKSNIIFGKYLRIVLGSDFLTQVSNCLYEEINFSDLNKYITPLVTSIKNLCIEDNNGNRIESIISFNYDCLIEKVLTNFGVTYSTIYKEDFGSVENCLPIYHVHGFLSDSGEKSEIVLSEDGYHEQYNTPYSWSNLVQLFKYSYNSCLFVGSSLEDPNQRRLLEISKLENNNNKHFIFMKLPKGWDGTSLCVDLVLREQDANMLGLNVIWVQSYDEIPHILEQIKK